MSKARWFWYGGRGWIQLPTAFLVWRISEPYYSERHGHGVTLIRTRWGRLRWEPK